MKKTELRKIIRESIIELINEQSGSNNSSTCSNIPAPGGITGQSGWYNTNNSLVQACNGMLPGWFQGCPNCVNANTTGFDAPQSNFQNMVQNGFANNGCPFLLNWMTAPNRQPQSVGGSNAAAGRLFYPGENPSHQANKMKKWTFVTSLHGNNC